MRVFLDGCFDLTHYGHFRAMQQARATGSHLTVGVLSDESIASYKAPPVLSMDERVEMVRSCRWADAVFPDTALALDMKFVQGLRKHLGIALIVHGDDVVTLKDGSDPYGAAKVAGMYWAIPRTPGVSTTLLTNALVDGTPLPACPLRLDLPAWYPVEGSVYVDGAFDCLHPGHIAFLKEARALGTQLIVGVHADEVVQSRRGKPPLQCVEDRARALACCRYVDGVLPASPLYLSQAVLDATGATCVARGTTHETDSLDKERYREVCGKVVYIPSPSTVTLATLRERIVRRKCMNAIS